jgi:glucose-6-phosphate dehydrogenase assembly protein OpcA
MSPGETQVQNSAVEQFLSGKLAAVDVAAIERELSKLWQEAAAAGESAHDGHNIARACVLNLILFTRDHDAEMVAGNILDDIMMRHPCRALLAIASGGEAQRIDAWVSARCHLAGPGSSKQICCEQIVVKSEATSAQALPSVIVPLLVPDLPVALWWRANDLDSETIEPFLPAVDRIIFDSIGWTMPRNWFGQAFSLGSRHDGPTPADLNWGRLLHWRRLIAKAFDSLGIGLAPDDFETIESVRMEISGSGDGQAALLIAWLANQLKWQPVSASSKEGATEVVFDGTGGKISAKWVAGPSEAVPVGNLVKVEIGLSGERSLDVQLRLQDGKPCLVAAAESVYGKGRDVIGRGPILDETALVERELDLTIPDRVFSATLNMASRLMDLISKKD